MISYLQTLPWLSGSGNINVKFTEMLFLSHPLCWALERQRKLNVLLILIGEVGVLTIIGPRMEGCTCKEIPESGDPRAKVCTQLAVWSPEGFVWLKVIALKLFLGVNN